MVAALHSARASEDSPRLGLSRPAVLVSDLGASLALYEGALGMRRVPYTEPIVSAELTALLGRDQVKPVAVIVLEADDGNRLALMHIEGETATPAPVAPMTFGQTSLLFSTDRIDDLYAAFRALELTVTRPPRDVPPDEPNALYAVDRDGVRLIVTQNVIPQGAKQ